MNNHCVVVLGLGPSGLFLVRQLSKITSNIYAVGRYDDVGMYSKYLKKNKGVYLYYFNIKEYRDQANSQEATKKEKSRYNQMRKKLDFSWTPTLKLVINGKFVDQYTFLDEDYYSLPSKKQKEKKQNYIDKLSSWLDQIYQD